VAAVALGAAWAKGSIDVVDAGTGWLLVCVLGYASSFGLVFRHYRTVRRTAVSLAFDPDPPAAPPLADAGLEQRLDALRDANAVVFTRDEVFVGSGEWIDHDTLIVDVSRKAKRDGGKRRAPEDFDGYELHQHLLAALPRGLHPAPLAGHRLYVRGGAARVGTGAPIFPHGPVQGGLEAQLMFRRPVNHVPDAVLERFLHEPDENARVYTAFEQRGWGGQVAVTLFVRAKVVVGRTLFVELNVLRQRQLMEVFWDVDSIRLQAADEIPALIRSVLPRAVPVLIGSPRRLWRAWRAPRNLRRELTQTARGMARHRYWDLGASSSLREDSASAVVSETDHFPWADEEMFYQMLTARLLDCIKDFLDSKGVDTSSFEKQQVTFVEKTTVKARDIYGSAVNNGTNTTQRKTAPSGSSGRRDGGD
jgi:hypothetical protein